MKILSLILSSFLLSSIPVVAQTADIATTTVTVVAPKTKIPASDSKTVVAAGTTIPFTIKTSEATGVATGSIEIQVQVPDSETFTVATTTPLIKGSVTCSYQIPVTATLGLYTIKAVYLAPATAKLSLTSF